MDLAKLKLTNKRKQICDRFGFNNSEDILSFYPFKYENYEIIPFSSFKEGNQVCFEAKVISAVTTFRKGRLSISRFKVLCEDNELLVTIFNRPWIKGLNVDNTITIIGKYDGNNKVTATNFYLKSASDVAGIVPTYSLKEGISQSEIRKLVKYIYENCEYELLDKMPSDLITKHNLISYKDAIKNIHFPTNESELKKAIARLKYEEFLRFYLALQAIKGSNDTTKNKKSFDINLIDKFIDSFSFKLTNDQIQSKDEILNDLASNKIMYRLLQGEVGSGKTAIAMIALYANYLAGFSGVLMAPTEVLAKQHYLTLKKTFEKYNIKIALLYSGLYNENEVKQNIKDGDYDIVVGTHALFSKDVQYNKLGLVIADEQHRFGVKQRKALRDKGENCDFLLMSATPIPRTLASSLYGDMDISTIETLPNNRKKCKTYLIKKNSIIDILDDIKTELKKGRQIYIIAAAIDKSENYNAKDVNGLYNSLKNELLPYNTYLLHGKLSNEQKDRIMERFNNNEIQVLISTTVIEVGINVENASMMIIYDADKFGVSTLHQLRGRIQRGQYEPTCYLLTSSKDENTLNRLEFLVNNDNGFDISMYDLKNRGPGDILGIRQSGLPTFILGDIFNDDKFVTAAKKDALEIINNLSNNEYLNYYQAIEEIASKNYID